jgi:hypothetical protein
VPLLEDRARPLIKSPSHRFSSCASIGTFHSLRLAFRLQTELLRKLTFTSPGKILELVRKGEAWGNLERRQVPERAIETGQGGCYLRLTPDQYARLRRP